ncbi:MAG: hypothetical protein AB1306_11820 [Nitrospirota bacterium]
MKPFVKTTLLAGAIFGVVMGVSVSLSMDFMMSGAEGGWYESVKHDTNLFLGPDWAERSWFIYSGIVVIVLGIGVIGGMIGVVFGFIIGKFFSMMSNSG